MKVAARIKRLEKLRPPEPYVPSIFFHSVVEPSKNDQEKWAHLLKSNSTDTKSHFGAQTMKRKAILK